MKIAGGGAVGWDVCDGKTVEREAHGRGCGRDSRESREGLQEKSHTVETNVFRVAIAGAGRCVLVLPNVASEFAE